MILRLFTDEHIHEHPSKKQTWIPINMILRYCLYLSMTGGCNHLRPKGIILCESYFQQFTAFGPFLVFGFFVFGPSCYFMRNILLWWYSICAQTILLDVTFFISYFFSCLRMWFCFQNFDIFVSIFFSYFVFEKFKFCFNLFLYLFSNSRFFFVSFQISIFRFQICLHQSKHEPH